MTIFHAKTVMAAFSGSVTASSATYINLLGGPGPGGTWQISFPKAAGTSLLVTMASAARAASGTTTATMGVSDGTTDYDAALDTCFVTGSRRVTFDGAVMIPASGAGTLTLTARVKISGTSVSFSTAESFSMSVLECGTDYANAACTFQSMATGMSGVFASYTDVKDGATPISLQITKRVASNKILYHQRLANAGSGAGVMFGGVNDGSVDTDVSSAVCPNGGYWTNNSGERLLTGHAAGSAITLKPRFKCSTSTSVGVSCSIWAVEVPP